MRSSGPNTRARIACRPAERPGRPPGLLGLRLVDDCPVIRLHRRNLSGRVLRNLDQVADVTETRGSAVDRLGIRHVNRDEALHPGALQRLDRDWVSAELLRHREHRQTQAPCFLAERCGVLTESVQVDQVGRGGKLAGLVQVNRRGGQTGVPAYELINEHARSLIDQRDHATAGESTTFIASSRWASSTPRSASSSGRRCETNVRTAGGRDFGPAAPSPERMTRPSRRRCPARRRSCCRCRRWG